MSGSRVGSVAIVMLLCASNFIQHARGQGAPVQKPGEPQPQRTFTLEQAVEFALRNYPAVRVALERLSAARAGVGLAQTSYLPRADMFYQANRATKNNIYGLLLPQTVISSMSGPVQAGTSNDSVWGSAAGVLVSWEPFDFGARAARVNVARAGQDRANSEMALTQLDVAVATANAYLTLLAAEQRVGAARANLDRRQVLATSVHTLVDNQLRPGADASRADAELARARTDLARAEQAEAISRAVLADILGIAGNSISIVSGPLLDLPPETTPPPSPVSAHPFAAAQQTRVNEVRARERFLDRSYFPRFDFQTSVFGRGSGANTDGSVQGGAGGLNLQRGNWASGLSISFPMFDIFSIRAEKSIEAANERAEAARYDQAIQDLTGQLQQIQATLEAARRIAQDTPAEVAAARATESQSRARYQAGLATIIEVAEAQSLLVQAETDDALARLAVWSDLASLGAAEGDLGQFLQFVHLKTQGGP